MPRSAALFTVSLLTLASASATAQPARRPTIATDAFSVGTRIGPGLALLATWEVDIYPHRSRIVSLGPGVAVSVLGTGVPAGQQQLVLVGVDVLRVKFSPLPGNDWRPWILLGGGFTYGRLPEQSAEIEVFLPGMDRPTAATQRWPALEDWAPMVTGGVGVDYFFAGPVGLTSSLTGRFHPTGTRRIPDAWLEVSAGVRFGL